MPLRRGVPLNFTGKTLSDAVDGSNVGRGAMAKLTNLIPNPTTPGTWVCRPGGVTIANFAARSPFTTPTVITALEVIGNVAYGMVTTGRNAGKDEPFAVNLRDGTPIIINGVTNANTPSSPPTSGDWTPPIVKKVGSRILVTHPGFPGDGGSDNTAGNYVKFGWLDVSGFEQTLEVDLVTGRPFLYGGFSLLGIQPGMAVTGSTLIPAGATVRRVFPNSQGAIYFTANSHTSTMIDGMSGPAFNEVGYLGKHILGPGVVAGTTIIATPTGASLTLSSPTKSTVTGGTFLVYGNIPSLPGWQSHGDFTSGSASILNAIVTDVHTGQLITASQLPAQTYVTGVTGTTIFLNQPATATQTAAPFACTGAVIEMSVNATGSGQGPVIVSGGTKDAPLWGAGDTAINTLPSVPLGLGEMNGRAWFACGDDGIPFSDALLACTISSATNVQALAPGNGLPCTAIGELKLTSSTLGGNVQGLIVFQGDANLLQITGDPTTLNLSMADLHAATGTHAPLTIVPTTRGTFFVSPEGLRLIDFSGRVSDPIGQDGQGVVAPFLAVSNPPLGNDKPASRMCAAANGRTVRITAPTGPQTFAEYWYDMPRGAWTGPHTSSAAHIGVWSNTFVLVPTTEFDATELRRSDDTQTTGSVYVENGAALEFEFETTLMPDNGQMAENKIVETSIGIALPTQAAVQINFLNEVRQPLDGVTLSGWGTNQPLWGTGIYGYTVGGAYSGAFMQRGLSWSRPLVFKQGVFNIRGASDPDLVLGNLYFRYQVLGYFMQALPNAS